jgi:lysophospholipase L1-like esterase
MARDSTTPERTRRSFLRRILVRFLTIGLSLFAALTLAELALRRFWPQESFFVGRGMYLPDPDVGHVLKPNHGTEYDPIRINSHGFRDREYPVEKPAGVYRIACIGDSFTFGATLVEDTYVKKLEKLFAAAPAPQAVEVMNLGVNGYNTRQSLAHLKKFGMRFDPDLVILGFYLGNDIEENESDIEFEVVDGELTAPHRRREKSVADTPPPSALVRFLSRFHLYRLLRRATLLRKADAATPRPQDRALENYLAVARHHMEVLRRKPRESLRRGAAKSESRLKRLRDDLAQHRVGLVVLVIPDELQVSPAAFERVLREFKLDPADFDPDRPTRWIRDVLDREGIACVDILEALRERNRSERVYFEEETHLNPTGNQVAAAALFDYLRAHNPALGRR